MSKAAASPTARLLQTSRLFSLPRPLPSPSLDTTSSTGLSRFSETATAPYPTYQAISTPASSHYRGDWGLKRSLPTKNTKNSSTPHIKVHAQDNTEHITDFGSAAEHTQTVRKWAEMGVPIALRRNGGLGRDMRKPPPTSVFEDLVDETTGRGGDRWKFGGPWIAGMQEGEFIEYVKNLTTRRGAGGAKDAKGKSKADEFREYVKDRLVETRLAAERSQAREAGDVLSPDQQEALRKSLRPTDKQLDDHFRDLRQRYASEGLSSKFTAYIADFLDLPATSAVQDAPTPTRNEAFQDRLLAGIGGGNADPESTPPSTHPSAGLFYLRTNGTMQNHPVHGPQAFPSPVLARVLRARRSAQGVEYTAKLGVGGIVTNDSESSTLISSRRKYQNPSLASGARIDGERNKYDPNEMAEALNPNMPGGNKLYVQPTSAYIDEKGRIRLEISRADPEAVAVKVGEVEHLHQRSAQTFAGPVLSRNLSPPGTAGNANYGTALPRSNVERARRPQIKGFGEAESRGTAPAGGNGQEVEALARIRELSKGAGMESRQR